MRMNVITRWVWVPAASLLAAVALSASEAPAPAPADPVAEVALVQAIEQGRKVYAANKCQACHMIDGAGSKRAPLDGVGSKLSRDDIRKWILTPGEMNPKVKKPSYAKIGAEDLEALVDYLFSLKAR
jgi:mono/diheme cytochrome c family protein